MAGIRSKALLTALLLATIGMSNPPITLHLAGDSTMAEKKPEKRPETGWGEALQQYFPVEKVVVRNYAKNGRSTRTFIQEGLWQELIANVKPGDFVFIEFAHNDEVPSKTDRYTPPDQYRANLIRFVNETRARQGTPVLLTPVSRRKFEKNGTVADSHREYSGIVRSVAAELKVALIDMDRKSAAVLETYGVEGSKQLFLQLDSGTNANYPNGVHDNTHFSPLGAELMAKLAVEGMREQKLGLVQYLITPRSTAALPRESRQASTLLSPERLTQLPAPQRAAWQRYRAASDSVRTSDSIALATELRASAQSAWTPAPTDEGFFLQDSMSARWFATDAAGVLANYIVSYQAPNGGWSKRMGFTHVRAPGEAYTSAENETWFSTFDNGGTTEELRFLGARINARADARLQQSFLRGIDFVMTAQQPAGCWPQIFPLAGSYHDAATFNDDVTVNALRLLRDVANGRYAFVPAASRVRAAEGVQRGIDCIVATQYVQNGRPTGWGAQHDPITLQPAKARAYEHPSLSGREGASVVRFLMEIAEPSPAVVRAVHAAAEWFKQSAIYGYTYAYKGELTPKPGAGPLWARFYELNTNRPIFSDRDAVVRYNLNEVGPERRFGYGWYTEEPNAMLKRYAKWAAQHPREK